MLASAVIAAATVVRRRLLVVTVRGESMQPAYADGDRVLVVRTRRWRRGSVVVGRIPVGRADEGEPWLFVKRVVGLPGEDVRLPRDRLHPDVDVDQLGGRVDGDDAVWAVPGRHIFVKGDAPFSADSVSWGPIPCDDVLGVVVRRMAEASREGLTPGTP